jgi:hypothetical protein
MNALLFKRYSMAGVACLCLLIGSAVSAQNAQNACE